MQNINFSKILIILKNNASLFFIIFFFTLINTIWIKIDTAPPMWDQSWYLENSQVLYTTLTQEGIFALFEEFTEIMKFKAPLLALLTIPFYLLFGNSVTSALIVNFTFIIIGSIYLFLLSRLILKSKNSALISVFVFNTFPLIFGLTREFLVEIGLTTFTIIWIYYLLCSNYLSVKKLSFKLGIILGLGLLIKISFLLYIIFPTFYVILINIKRERKITKALIINLVILFFTGSIIASTWYLKNLADVLRNALMSGYGNVGADYGMGNIFSIKTISTYWITSINYAISAYYFFLALVGSIIILALHLKKKVLIEINSNIIILFSWFLPPFIVFTFGVNKDFRFLSPLLPAISIYIAFLIMIIQKIKNAKFLIPILLVFPFINYFYISFSYPNDYNITFIKSGFILLQKNMQYSHPPIKENWPNEKLVDTIKNDAARINNFSATTTLLFEHKHLNHNNLSYIKTKKNTALVFTTSPQYTKDSFETILDKVVSNSDYIISKSDKIGADFLNINNKKIAALLSKNQLPFKEMETILLPDETFLKIYKKNISSYKKLSEKDLTEESIDFKSNINFSNKLSLLGYNISQKENALSISYYWKANDIIKENYKIFTHVYNNNEIIIINDDHYPTNGILPTYEWNKGEIIRENRTIKINPNNNISIFIGIFNPQTGERLIINNSTNNNETTEKGFQLFPFDSKQ